MTQMDLEGKTPNKVINELKLILLLYDALFWLQQF